MLQAKRKKEIKCGGLNSVTVAESNTARGMSVPAAEEQTLVLHTS